MLHREVNCQLSVKSPYVVELFGITESENNYYLLLEFCNGGTLTSFVEKRGNFLLENEGK